MILQIWPIEKIENIFWAFHTIMGAAAPILIDEDCSTEYRQDIRRGFELGLERAINSFSIMPPSLTVWTQEHLNDVLMAARSGVHANANDQEQAEVVDAHPGLNRGLDAALWSVATVFGVDLQPIHNDDAESDRKVLTIANPKPLFRRDVQNILSAIEKVWQTMIDVSTEPGRLVEYTKGFETGLNLVAQSLGIELLPRSNSSARGAFPHWRRQDIEQELLAAYEKMPPFETQSGCIVQANAHQQGYKAALKCLATSFGIELNCDSNEQGCQVSPGLELAA